MCLEIVQIDSVTIFSEVYADYRKFLRFFLPVFVNFSAKTTKFPKIGGDLLIPPARDTSRWGESEYIKELPRRVSIQLRISSGGILICIIEIPIEIEDIRRTLFPVSLIQTRTLIAADIRLM